METESEGGQKFLPPNPLPFCPLERLDFKIRNSDFLKKIGSNFNQKTPLFLTPTFTTLTAGSGFVSINRCREYCLIKEIKNHF